MKIIALIIMLIALFLLYRIAYPSRSATKNSVGIMRTKESDISEVVIKTRFVRPNYGQPPPTATTSTKADSLNEMPSIFVGGNEKIDSVIPVEKFDKVFGKEANPDDLDIELDDNETDNETIDVGDEAAEFEQGAELAIGMSIEEMTEAAKAIDNPTDEKANILFKVEKTDMFEKLVSGDEGKAERIKAIIERHFRKLQPEIEIEENENGDIENIDVSEFLGLIKKR